jgi:hypothetical protein
MFTPDVSESTRIAEMSFIAGVPYETLKQCAKEILKFENIQLKPEILFSFPDNKGIIYNSVLDVKKQNILNFNITPFIC